MRSQPDRSETLLVLRAQSGDREALDALLTGVQPALRRYVRMIARDEARADDALQETFIVVVRKLHGLRDAALFRPWVYRIAARQARGRQRPADLSLDETAEPGSTVDLTSELVAAEVRSRLRDAVMQLPERSREAVALHYFHELSFEEIAAVLDIPVGTVKSRVAYGLARLRSQETKS